MRLLRVERVQFSLESADLAGDSVLVECALCSCLHELLLSMLESLCGLSLVTGLYRSEECLLSFLDVVLDSGVSCCLLVFFADLMFAISYLPHFH